MNHVLFYRGFGFIFATFHSGVRCLSEIVILVSRNWKERRVSKKGCFMVMTLPTDNPKIMSRRNRLVLYWIIGGFVLMALMFYFMLRSQNSEINTDASSQRELSSPARSMDSDRNNESPEDIMEKMTNED